jgi:hypothetical protein
MRTRRRVVKALVSLEEEGRIIGAHVTVQRSWIDTKLIGPFLQKNTPTHRRALIETQRRIVRPAISPAHHPNGGCISCRRMVQRAKSAAAAYGPNLAGLQRLKKQLDPENIFRLNMNILPGG